MTDLNDSNGELLYRFRSMERLIEKEELQNREIHFASAYALNDPMEGFLNVTWKGDRIAWENFFENFIIALASLVVLSGLRKTVSVEDLWIPERKEAIEWRKSQEIVKSLFQTFFEDQGIQGLLCYLSNNPTPLTNREVELLLQEVLSPLANHAAALCGYIPRYNAPILDVKRLENLKLFLSTAQPHEAETILRIESLRNEIRPILKRGKIKRTAYVSYVYLDFIPDYLKKLQRTIHRGYLSASFCLTYRNPALWSYYADAHRGVALIFKRPLHLIEIDSEGKKNEVTTIERAIKYDSDPFPEIDAFSNFAYLTNDCLQAAWLRDEKGNCSKIIESYIENINENRFRYWDMITETRMRKTNDWKHEREVRFMMQSRSSSEETDGKTCYFESDSLEGIILGCHSSRTHQEKVRDIIEEMNRERNTPIKLYQAYYIGNKIEKIELNS